MKYEKKPVNNENEQKNTEGIQILNTPSPMLYSPSTFLRSCGWDVCQAAEL